MGGLCALPLSVANHHHSSPEAYMSERLARRLAKAAAIQNCPRAIVRSAFDELAVLRVVRTDAAQVVVASEDGQHRVGMPRSHVFGFSESARQLVESALSGNDAKEIASAWAQLDPYED